jgi:hypothetical protein
LLLRKRHHILVVSTPERGCARCACSYTRGDAVGLRRGRDARVAGRVLPAAAPPQPRCARFSVEFAVLNTRLNSERKRWICGFRKAQAGLEPMIRALCSNVV